MLPLYKCYTHLQAGSFFGELALEKNKRRRASIVCDTDCHIAFLEKKDYKKILGKKYLY